MGIRDHWDAPNGALQPHIEALKSVLGTNVDVQPEWSIIQAELAPIVADKQQVVELVSADVGAWCKVFAGLLEDEANEDWTATVVDKAAGTSRLLVSVDVRALLRGHADGAGRGRRLPRH